MSLSTGAKVAIGLSIAAVVIGGGIAVYYFVIRKKDEGDEDDPLYAEIPVTPEVEQQINTEIASTAKKLTATQKELLAQMLLFGVPTGPIIANMKMNKSLKSAFKNTGGNWKDKWKDYKKQMRKKYGLNWRQKLTKELGYAVSSTD